MGVAATPPARPPTSGYTEPLLQLGARRAAAREARRRSARASCSRGRPTTASARASTTGRCILDRAHVDVAIDLHADGGPPDGRGSPCSSRSPSASEPRRRRPSLRLRARSALRVLQSRGTCPGAPTTACGPSRRGPTSRGSTSRPCRRSSSSAGTCATPPTQRSSSHRRSVGARRGARRRGAPVPARRAPHLELGAVRLGDAREVPAVVVRVVHVAAQHVVGDLVASRRDAGARRRAAAASRYAADVGTGHRAERPQRALDRDLRRSRAARRARPGRGPRTPRARLARPAAIRSPWMRRLSATCRTYAEAHHDEVGVPRGARSPPRIAR